MDPHLHAGPTAHERSRRAGVVEVDVGEEDCAWNVAAELAQQLAVAGLGAGVDEHIVDREAADHALEPEVADVQLADRGHDGGTIQSEPWSTACQSPTSPG